MWEDKGILGGFLRIDIAVGDVIRVDDKERD